VSTISPGPRAGPEPAATAVPIEGPDKQRDADQSSTLMRPPSRTAQDLVVYALQGRYDVEAVDTEAGRACDRDRPEAVHGEVTTSSSHIRWGRHPERWWPTAWPGPTFPSQSFREDPQRRLPDPRAIPNDVGSTPPAPDRLGRRLSAKQDELRGAVVFACAYGRRFVLPAASDSTRRSLKRSTQPPALKATREAVYYTWLRHGLLPATTLRNPVARAGDRREKARGVTAIAVESDPFTYFDLTCRFHLRRHRLDDGHALDGPAQERPNSADMLPIATACSASACTRRKACQRSRRRRRRRAWTARSRWRRGRQPRPFTVPVDADYIGEGTPSLSFGVEPDALTIVS